jgi:hypothetical protein
MADPVVCLLTDRLFKLLKCEDEAGGWRIVYTILTVNPESKRAFWRPTVRWSYSSYNGFKRNRALLCGLGSSGSGY